MQWGEEWLRNWEVGLRVGEEVAISKQEREDGETSNEGEDGGV